MTIRANLIWGLLFLDVLVLILRAGSQTFADYLFHVVCLAAAFVLLTVQSTARRVSARLWLLAALPLGAALIQALPFPEAWAPWLAPIKHRIVGEANGLFDLGLSASPIAMTPVNHWLGLFRLGLDLWLAWIAYRAAPPSYGLFRAWLLTAGVVIGGLAAAAGLGWIGSEGPLSYFHGTHGGLVNDNHFAALAIALMGLLFCDGLRCLRESRPTLRRGVMLALPNGLAVALLLGGLRDAYSRSSLALFAAATLFLAFYLTRSFAAGNLKRLAWAGLLAALAMAALLPWGAGARKFAKEGVESGGRAEVNLIGLAYLGEAPLLGTGLGSAATLLDPVGPRPHQRNLSWRHFHNEYLEMVLEYGLAGLAFLALLAWTLADLLRIRAVENRDRAMLMAGAAWMTVAVFSALSLISFPLRVVGVKAFVVVVVLFAAKLTAGAPPPRVRPSRWQWLLPALVLLPGALTWRSWQAARAECAPWPELRQSIFFDDHSRAGLYAARQSFVDLIRGLTADEAGLRRIEATRTRFADYLRQEPFNITALVMLLQLDIMEHRIGDMGFDPERFAVWKAKAKRIEALGAPHNHNGKLGLLFLYQVYPEYLNPAERRELAALEEEFHYLLNYTATENKKQFARGAFFMARQAAAHAFGKLF